MTDETELDNLGMKWVKRSFHVRGDAKIVECCGCGFPVNQNNPRCLVMDPDSAMGTYGPCCAPGPGEKARRLARRAFRRFGRAAEWLVFEGARRG